MYVPWPVLQTHNARHAIVQRQIDCRPEKLRRFPSPDRSSSGGLSSGCGLPALVPQGWRRQRSGGSKAGLTGAADDSTDGGSALASGASESGQTIMDYMRLKQAVCEAQKAVADWQRKLEVAAGAAWVR